MIHRDTDPGTLVFVNIIVNGVTIKVPGITTDEVYGGTYKNRNTGSEVPTEFVDAITFHAIPAEQSRTGEARSFWKHQRQTVSFMDYRNDKTDPCPEIDGLTADELFAKVAESLAQVQAAGINRVLNRTANDIAEAVKGKAVFGPSNTPVTIQPLLQPAKA